MDECRKPHGWSPLAEVSDYADMETAAMQVPGGVLVRTVTTEGDSLSTALCFVPGTKLEDSGWIYHHGAEGQLRVVRIVPLHPASGGSL